MCNDEPRTTSTQPATLLLEPQHPWPAHTSSQSRVKLPAYHSLPACHCWHNSLPLPRADACHTNSFAAYLGLINLTRVESMALLLAAHGDWYARRRC